MKIREGFVLRRVMGQAMAIAVGETSRTFKGMVKLNDTAADMWEWMAEDVTEEQLASRLQEKYDVDAATAKESVEQFVASLKEQGLLAE
ncbi:MAG: PqqD family protein [Clostridia bacterium]|nr:PqqD family protein [Clostridia bacterium]